MGEVTLRTICRRGHAKEPSGRCKECERLRKTNVTPYLKSSPTRTAASARAVASASVASPSTKQPRRGSVVRLTSAPELAASRSCPGRNAATARLKSAIGSSTFRDDDSCVFANWLHGGPKVRTVSLTFLRLLPR